MTRTIVNTANVSIIYYHGASHYNKSAGVYGVQKMVAENRYHLSFTYFQDSKELYKSYRLILLPE